MPVPVATAKESQMPEAAEELQTFTMATAMEHPNSFARRTAEEGTGPSTEVVQTEEKAA